MNILLLSVGLFYAFAVSDAPDLTFCGEFRSSDQSSVIDTDVTAILDICSAELGEYEGIFVLVDGRPIPLPAGYLIDSESGEYRVTFEPLSSVVPERSSSHGMIYVDTIEKSIENVSQGSVETERLESPVGSEGCDASVELFRHQIYRPNGGLFGYATELYIDDALVVVFGESPDLLRAMADSFVRLNCSRANKALD